MAVSEDFKAALRAGKLAQAFALAMSKAVELNITTWVESPDDDGRRGETTSGEPKSGNRLRTRINLIEGAIDNEIGDRFISNSPYKKLHKFHKQQVSDVNYVIDNNLQSLQTLFRALAILKQQQLTNSSGKQALFPGDIASRDSRALPQLEAKDPTTVKLQPEEGLPEEEDLEYPILTLADLEPEEEGNSIEEKSSEDSSRFNNSPQQVEKLASVAYEDLQQKPNSQEEDPPLPPLSSPPIAKLCEATALGVPPLASREGTNPSLDSKTQPLDFVIASSQAKEDREELSESSSWESEEQVQRTVQPKISRRGEDWETFLEVPKETDEQVSSSMEEEEEDWEEFSEDITDKELILEQLKSVRGKKDDDWGDWMVEEEADLANIPQLESLDLEENVDWDNWEEPSPFTEVANQSSSGSEEEEFDLDLDSIAEVGTSKGSPQGR